MQIFKSHKQKNVDFYLNHTMRF